METTGKFEEFKANNPHLSRIWPYMEALYRESPRGKVLISAGFLEEDLRRVLLAYFREDSQTKNMVDGADAPLGTFSARIAACHLLALISDDERHDLDLIRKIRNDFAHNLDVSFDRPSVVSRCGELRLKAHDYVHPDLGQVVVPAQEQFETAAVGLILNLVNRPHYVSQKRCKWIGWNQ